MYTRVRKINCIYCYEEMKPFVLSNHFGLHSYSVMVYTNYCWRSLVWPSLCSLPFLLSSLSIILLFFSDDRCAFFGIDCWSRLLQLPLYLLFVLYIFFYLLINNIYNNKTDENELIKKEEGRLFQFIIIITIEKL